MNTECDYKSDEYCVYELACWENDDHCGREHRFPDAGVRHCEYPCPYHFHGEQLDWVESGCPGERT